MGQEIPEQNQDETSASTSIRLTPQQDGAPVPLDVDEQSIVPEAAKAGSDAQSLKRGSTGPRSEAGKQRSRRNAFKHGFFAKVILIPSESSAEYRALLENLRDEWQPVNETDKISVEMIATIVWRLRRFYASESAEICRAREFAKWDKRNAEQEEADGLGTKSGDSSHILDPEPGLVWKLRNPEILGRCLELLWELQRKIKGGAFEHERNTEILKLVYGTNKRLRKTLYQSYIEWANTAKQRQEIQLEGSETAEAFRKCFLSGIAKEIRRVRDYQREQATIESERLRVEVLRCNVPESDRCELFLKYEATLLRELDRVVNQLERRQRLRRGLPVAPSIDLSLRA